MRQSVLWNMSHVRLSLVLLLALIASLAAFGCGGGGGGGTTIGGNGSGVPKGDPTKATVTGIVTDTSAAAVPIKGALISIAGTTLSTKTGADGKFAIVNVPVGSVGISVTTPDASAYYGYVQYGPVGGLKIYDTQKCPISITTQASSKGTSAVPYNLSLFSTGSPPPPPNVNVNTGCPN